MIQNLKLILLYILDRKRPTKNCQLIYSPASGKTIALFPETII